MLLAMTPSATMTEQTRPKPLRGSYPARGDGVCVGPGGEVGDAGAEPDGNEVDEAEGGPQADEGKEEDFAPRRALRVVDVEVGGGGGPRVGHVQADVEEGEALRGEERARGLGLRRGVEVGARDADEDEEGEDLGEPRVSW